MLSPNHTSLGPVCINPLLLLLLPFFKMPSDGKDSAVVVWFPERLQDAKTSQEVVLPHAGFRFKALFDFSDTPERS